MGYSKLFLIHVTLFQPKDAYCRKRALACSRSFSPLSDSLLLLFARLRQSACILRTFPAEPALCVGRASFGLSRGERREGARVACHGRRRPQTNGASAPSHTLQGRGERPVVKNINKIVQLMVISSHTSRRFLIFIRHHLHKFPENFVSGSYQVGSRSGQVSLPPEKFVMIPSSYSFLVIKLKLT